MKKILLVVFAVASLSGCAQVLPIISKVQSALNEVPMLLEAIRAAEAIYFAAHPDPVLQTHIDRALADAALAGAGANDALTGVKDISDNKAAEAFAAWNKAYDSLLAVMRDAHIVVPMTTTHVAAVGPAGPIRLPLHPRSAAFGGG